MPSAVATSLSAWARRYPRKAALNIGARLVTLASRCSNRSLVRCSNRRASLAAMPPSARTSSSSVKNQPSTIFRSAPCGVSAVAKRSVRRRYTVSKRCSGVSVSEIWTSDVAKPRFRARSANQRAKNVFPQPYSPRTALNTLPPALTLCSSSSRVGVKRSNPTAKASRLLPGTVPRRRASMISCRF